MNAIECPEYLKQYLDKYLAFAYSGVKSAVHPEKMPTQAGLQDLLTEMAQNYVNAHLPSDNEKPENLSFVSFAVQNDPALKNRKPEDVSAELATYPGVIAIAAHDVAYELYKKGRFADARILSEAAHSRTGIDIHPGTKIEKNCFIDHGTGDVIGETAEIGKNTVIYHGVTLGGWSGGKTKVAPEHRHPVIGSNCVISTDVKILGNVQGRR